MGLMKWKICFTFFEFSVIVLLASASRAYIESVLFRVSAFTGAKFASGVPAVIGRFGP